MDDEGALDEAETHPDGTESPAESDAESPAESDAGADFGMAAYPLETYDPSSGRRTKRRRWIGGTATLVVLGAIGLAAGIQATSGGPRALDATVAASVNHTLASKTAAINLKEDVRVGSTEVTATGPGVIDFTHGAMSVNLDVQEGSQSAPITAVYLGREMYEEIPGLSQLEPGKSWVTFDLSGAPNDGTGALAGGGNPAAMLGILSQRGAIVTPTGTTVVRGVRTRGYQVTITKGMVEKELSSGKLSSWMQAVARTVTFSDATETVYVDGSNRLRRFDFAMAFTVKDQTVSVNDTLDLSDYGTPAVIAAPPASETIGFDQFLKDAQAARPSLS
jgi:hypothetical protein